MEKFIPNNYKLPIFLDYKLKKTKKTLWVLFNFNDKKEKRKIQYKDNFYYVQLNKYHLYMFKGLFYFIDSNTIDVNYKKDYC